MILMFFKENCEEEEETVALPNENETGSYHMLSQPFLVDDEIDAAGSDDEDGDTSYGSIGKFFIIICLN